MRQKFGLDDPKEPDDIDWQGNFLGHEGLNAVREYLEGGPPPVLGGYFDQPHWFWPEVRALRHVRSIHTWEAWPDLIAKFKDGQGGK